MKSRFTFTLLLLLLSPAFAAEGVIPSQSYSANEQWEMISPQISDMHVNQPSVFNGYAILAGDAEHEIWDISNPYVPVKKAGMISNHADGEAESHQVTYGRSADGSYYLATISGRGIDIWDMTNTTSPILTGEVILPGINYGDVTGGIWGICWQGDYLYIGATTLGLYVVDVSNPQNPSYVATVPTNELGGAIIGPLFALGDLLVTTPPKGHTGIATIDISNPLEPKLMDADVSGPDTYIGGFYGGNAYMINPIRTFDVTTNPKDIKIIGSKSCPESEYMSFANNFLYLGGLRGGTQGIYKYDITNPNDPAFIGKIQGRSLEFDDQFSCPVGNILIIADDQFVNNQYVGAVIAVQDTDPDVTGISVIKSFPSDGSSNQSLSGQVALSFSEWPEFASVDPSSFILRQKDGLPLSGTWGCTYTTLTFAPDQPLSPLTAYEIVLPAGGITDLVGNAISTDFVSSFSTGTGTNVVAEIAVEDVNPTVLGETTTFSVETPDADKVYLWEFGDGETSIGSSVNYTYSAPGRYNAIVRSLSKYITHEAEDANLSGPTVQSNNGDFSGNGYADYPTEQGANVYVEWTITEPVSRSADLSFNYALGPGGSRPLELVVNGVSLGDLNLTETGSWSTWRSYVASEVPLNAGFNSIKLQATAGSQGPNIDSLRYELNYEEGEALSTTSFLHVVHRQLTENPPTSSQAMILSESIAFSVHPDANTVSAFDLSTLNQVFESPVGQNPVAVAEAPNGSIWILNRDSYSISVISKAGALLDTFALPYQSKPSGLAFLPNGSSALVTLKATGHILKLDPSTGALLGSITVPADSNGIIPTPEGIAISADSMTAYVTRAISPDASGQVYQVNTTSFNTASGSIIDLAYDVGVDNSRFSRGLPNYLHSITVSPDGARVWIPSKKDNIERGLARDGLELGHDVTVRAINSVIDASTNTEILSARTDFDNSDRAHSAAFSPLGDVGFVTLPGNDKLAIVDAYSHSLLTTIDTKDVPVASVYDESTGKIAILNFLGRSLSVYDVSDIFTGGTQFVNFGTYKLVAEEPLSAEVLQGKKFFYSAGQEFNQSGYMSCASCHIDGTHDGRTYDFTSLGEGFRNTIDLKGKSGTGHGRIHWSANFDEIHDFENQAREFGGSGLLNDDAYNYSTRSEPLGLSKSGISDDLDALNAYVSSLNTFDPSPYRNVDGSLTTSAVAGKAVFEAVNCASCHGGDEYTDSNFGALHDVGTMVGTSGNRLGGVLTGLDTPTLRGLWNTAPYLHDGSAPTLYDVLVTKNPEDMHGVISALTQVEIENLIEYLLQIDNLESSAPAPTSPNTNTFANFVNSYGLTGTDADPSANPDGDTKTNFEEFLLGGSDPTLVNKDRSVVSQVADVEGGDDHLMLSVAVPEGGVWNDGGYQVGGMTYTPLFSYDLNSWNVTYTSVENPDLSPAQSGYQWISFCVEGSITDQKKAFGRLNVTEIPK